MNMIRYSTWNGWRTLVRINIQVQTSSSSAPTTAAGLQSATCSESPNKGEEPNNGPASVGDSSVRLQSEKSTQLYKERRTSMVAAAFASLKGATPNVESSSLSLEDSIAAADSVESLLLLAEEPLLSRRHALRIVSHLADWTTSGRVKLADFEADTRFIKLCRLLGRGLPRDSSMEKDATGFGDLAVVLGVTGDDEAAKLIAGISFNQMIRIMTSLAHKQRRSTPLLRSLAFNIARQEDKLNIKDCADLLFAMATLNFPDELLLEKTCSDLCECITSNEKPAVVGSILTSLGLLRYKNTEVLNVLADWVVKHLDICRPQDLTSLFLTLATVCHIPDDANTVFSTVLPQVTMQDVPNPSSWLDVVWSLVVLDRATPQHIASVLDPGFCSKLVDNTDGNQRISVSSKLKLLNINAAAQLKVTGYKGPLLPPDSDVRNVPLIRSREKQLLVASILDSFSNLLPSATYLRNNIDTGMGFLLDGECMLDSKCNPLPVGKEVTKSKSTETVRRPVAGGERKVGGTSNLTGNHSTSGAAVKGTRIGILAWDYRDMCRGCSEPNGVAVLCMKLLEAAGYKVLSIPHTEYNPREKLVRRVQYLDHHLKSLVKKS